MMRSNFLSLLMAGLLMLGSVGIAQAIQIDATITADNYYAVYTGDETAVSFIGRNELNRTGSSGTYNWSAPENYSFNAGEYIYIAAWSDASTTQAWLGEFTLNGKTLLSNDTDWEVFLTYEDPKYGDGLPAPDNASVLANIIEANSVGWAPIFETRNNGDQPWGTISGISTDADWIWGSKIEAVGEGEYQLFRTKVVAVPEPGTLLLLGSGLAGLALYRRRMNKA